MKKLIIAAALLTGTHSATAAVDWTLYLKGIKDDCGYYSKDFLQAMGCSVKRSDEGWYYPTGKPQKAKMPKALQASVVSLQSKATYEDSHNSTIKFKNATAFGRPITSIQLAREFGETTLPVTLCQQ